jgi:hypothetical protein
MARETNKILFLDPYGLGEASDELLAGPPSAPLDLAHVGHVIPEDLGQTFLGPAVLMAPIPEPPTEPFPVA